MLVNIPSEKNIETRAPLESPALVGVPTSPTAEAGTSTEQIATTAFVQTAIENAESYTVISTLLASNWTGDAAPFTQTVSIDAVTSDTSGIVGIADTATDEQYQAAVKAQLRKTEQAEGTLTIKAYGTLPTVDIPISVQVI